VTETGKEYYYIRNGQGDIIALIDDVGTQVASYSYNSWGKLITLSGEMTESVWAVNPYRYRGYRYDSEIKLYYLQSRYYNPEWCRFINADAIAGQVGELLSHNLFAYVKNNPINLKDSTGFTPQDAYDEETEEQRAASYAKMNESALNRVILKPGSDISFDYLGTARDTAITATQYTPITVKIPQLNNISIKTSLAELKILENTFSVISIATFQMSIRENNLKFMPAEAAVMNLIDAATFAGGAMATTALISASAGAVPIILTGVLIGVAGYGLKKGADILFDKWNNRK
jgi:RHS repeat-associated protein